MFDYKKTDAVEKDFLSLTKGDVFNDIQLGAVAFDGWVKGGKSINIIDLRTGKGYRMKIRFPLQKFNIIGRYEKPKPSFTNDYNQLKKGDHFLIERNVAECFKFKEYTRSGKIVAVNPFDETKQWTIASSFKVVKITNLK